MGTTLEVEIVIALDGTVTTRVVGGHGRTCRDATKALRDAIGQTTEDRALPGFYQEATQTDRVRSRS
jgi:hypothetical protein